MALMHQNPTDKTCCVNLNTIDNGRIEAMAYQRKTETEEKIAKPNYF